MVMADRPVDVSRWAKLRRRPILLFIAVTLLVSYGLGIPALIIAGAWVPGINGVAKLYVGRFLVVAGPTCGALAAVVERVCQEKIAGLRASAGGS